MILSGGIAFIWVDARQGAGWSWPEVYRVMALFMIGAAVFSALLVPRLVDAPRPTSVARHDLLGFLAVAAAVAIGFVVTRYAFSPLARVWVGPLARVEQHRADAATTLGRPGRSLRGHRLHAAAGGMGGARAHSKPCSAA